ncbi:hypothetical protein [Pontiella agarivorans]|uniref:DUF2846 domain-containing protein n=1 Tax=Pontiella agarivorans TaxID=3038953 RepID=A0ABU5N2A4_9BACT|nr:hypothetical protein [Pontiella agarivorans]MDZ8120552.1 hypothetical protein [Pontiella agarivorans]
MNKIILSLTLLIAGITFTGCSTKAYLPTLPDTPDYGKVTLIRINTEPTAQKLIIYSKDEKIATLRNYSTVTFSLPRGPHDFSISWPNTGSYFENEISLNIMGNDHHYFAINHYFEIQNYKRYPRHEKWMNTEIVNVLKMDKQSAEKLITEQNL